MKNIVELPHPQLSAHERTIFVELWYSRVESNPNVVDISLCDVRASDGIRIQYDFDRDGWIITQQSLIDHGNSCSGFEPEDWKEVAFVKSWGRMRPAQVGDVVDGYTLTEKDLPPNDERPKT